MRRPSGPPAGTLRHRVAFDVPDIEDDDYGGEERFWTEVHRCRAEFRYQRGGEEKTASALTGMATFKVRLRASDAARSITEEYRMRDLRTEKEYRIDEVDRESDRRSVWLIVTRGSPA